MKLKTPYTKMVDRAVNNPLIFAYSVSCPVTDAGKITFAANANYAVNTGAISIWAKVPTGTVKVFIELYTSANDRTSLYMAANILTVAAVRGGVSLLNNATSFTNDGNWHHYVATWDGTSYVVYVDGVAKFTSSANYVLTLGASTQISISSALSTGVFPAGGNYFGLGLYKTKLNPRQVLDLYQFHGQPPSIVGRWDMQAGGTTSIVPTDGKLATNGTFGTGDTWTTTIPSGTIRFI